MCLIDFPLKINVLNAKEDFTLSKSPLSIALKFYFVVPFWGTLVIPLESK